MTPWPGYPLASHNQPASNRPQPAPERPAAGLPRPPQGQNPVALLIDTVKILKWNGKPDVARLVEKIAIKGDQRAAERLLRRLARPFYQQLLTPDPFLTASPGLEGEVLLGHTDAGHPVSLTREDLNRHGLITGSSGTGKSTLVEQIIVQLSSLGIYTLHYDLKGDLCHAVRDGIDSIRWSERRDNFLCPADSATDIHEYRNDEVRAISGLHQFQARGTAVIFKAIDTLYHEFDVYSRWQHWDWSSMTFPTPADLLLLLESKAFTKRVSGLGRESLRSAIDKLESLLAELGPLARCHRGFDIGRLYRSGRVISYMCDGLSPQATTFLAIIDLVKHSHFFKSHGPRNRLLMVCVLEEAKNIVGRHMQDNFTMKHLVSTVREYGIGILAIDQIPAEISQFYFSNISTLVMFRHSDGADLQRLRYSSGATADQSLANYTLKQGQAVLRNSRAADLLKIRVPFKPVEKFIPREEVDRLMAPRLAELHADVIPAKPAAAPAPAAPPSQPPGLVLDPDERALVQAVARDPDRPSSEVYKELGNPSKAFRTKQRLVAKGYLSEVVTSLGRNGTRANYLVPDQCVLVDLGIPLSSEGRGKALHKHFQAEFKAQAERLGFTARIEDGGGTTPVAPDLAVRKPGMQIAVEVAITSKPATEQENVKKNLSLGFDRVILTFITKRALEKTRQLAAERYPAEVLERVRFCLVNSFSSTLEGV